MIYLDTSIIVPAYCTEPLSHRVDELLQRDTDLVISNLTEVEFCSALSRKLRQRELVLDAVQQLSNNFRADLDMGIFQKLPVKAVHYEQAKNWISRFNTVLRTLDALHLALAHELQIAVVTGDIRLAQSAQILGVDVELVLP